MNYRDHDGANTAETELTPSQLPLAEAFETYNEEIIHVAKQSAASPCIYDYTA